MEEMPTREIFRHFSPLLQALFYVVAGLSTLVFAYGFYRRIQKYRRGRREDRFSDLGRRLRRAAAVLAENATLWKRDPYSGLAHTLIFWGFVVLFIGTVVVFIDHDILRFFGAHLLQGRFYLGFSLVLDLFGVLFIAGLLMMMLRRGFFRLPQLDYRRADAQGGNYERSGYRWDDRVFLGLLLSIALTGFLLEGFRIAADSPAFEVWSPVGWGLAGLAHRAGFRGSANEAHLYIYGGSTRFW